MQLQIIEEDPDGNDPQDDDDGSRFVILFGGNTSGQMEAKMFDETGYTVVLSVAKKFEQKQRSGGEKTYVIMCGGKKSGQMETKLFDETGYVLVLSVAEKFEKNTQEQ